MELRDKIFLDTDVTLDHLADRQPFAEYAHRIFALAEAGKLVVCLSALSFSNLYYLLRKLRGHDAALDLLRELKRIVRVSAVSGAEIESALGSGFRDFEDGIKHFTAAAEGDVSTIVTRNHSDYVGSRIPVRSPEDLLAIFERVK